jgi:hypothetical protein
LDITRSLWGFHKMGYTLKDLESWILQKHKDAHLDRKGKRKETASKKGKRSDDDEDCGEASTSLPKRSHKKSVGGRKQ